MAVKSNFASGDVLTASDVNTYLTNGGLVYITTGTAAAGASNLIIDNCFTTTYTNYRIVISFANASAGWPAVYFYMRVGGTDQTGANYYYMGNGRNSANADASYATAAQNFGYAGSMTGTIILDVISPYTTNQTLIQGQTTFYDGTNFYGRTIQNWHNSANYMDGIKFFPGSSTFNQFTARVYGYRQA